MAEAVHERFNAFKGEGPCGDAGGGLHGAAEESTGLGGSVLGGSGLGLCVLRLRVLGLCVLGLAGVLRGGVPGCAGVGDRGVLVLGRVLVLGLVAGGWGRGGWLLLFVEAEEAAEEAGVFVRVGVLGGLVKLLSGLGYLCFCLRQLCFCLRKCVLLHEDGLGEDVEGIGIAGEGLVQELLGFEVLFVEDGLVDAGGEVLNHLLFLRGHGAFLVECWGVGRGGGRKGLGTAVQKACSLRACGVQWGCLSRSFDRVL